MADAEYAAECEACQAWAVSTTGTDWTRAQLEDLVRTHVRRCRAESIALVERTDDGETVVETITAEVTAR